MAEKVRYYLEQSVPELEDLTKKGLFEKNEITMIMRRRTDFEHRIQGRGSKPRDFLKYAEFEGNLEKLRKKRYTRLSKVGLVDQKPSLSDWAGSRRILFIFDRATRRYPGDLSIWSQYLKFAKSNGAIKVIYKVYSRLLQLQPRNVDAWLSAAKYEFETNANAKGARVLFQRALRFNPESLELWLSYAQFELTYISRLLARRKVLGLITKKQQEDHLEAEKEKLALALSKDKENEMDDDVIALPTTTGEDDMKEELKHLPEADMNMLGNPETNPALRGDVALTVFDLCIPAILKTIPEYSTVVNEQDKAFEIVYKFLQLFDHFEDLNRDYLYMHILNYLQNKYPQDTRTLLIDVTLPIRTITSSSEELAATLQLSINKFMAYKLKLTSVEQKTKLVNMFVEYLEAQFLDEENKPSAKTEALLRAIIKKCKSS
ncbi:U3 small nucleolar RNA-associated protein 6 [[Candida] anglica]|uniref:U3 small nucleolar RNA-associated protein 6 n=1 Tax=[Candida] anglica TaxID=148631 RepID=A0ABP0E741_9ASCO